MSLFPLSRPARVLLAVWTVGMSPMVGAHATSCQAEARSLAKPPTVVELYTSEGCSSCPPADRWLSSLPGDERTLALGFHVNYWDHLGWKDRLATPATTERQYRWKAALGSRYVYTPQVIVNGVDERSWSGRTADSLPRLVPAVVPVVRMRRDGRQVQADVDSLPAARRLAGYWAVLAPQVRSEVTRGENAGRTLLHDHVVRRYLPVQPWPATRAQQLTLDLGDDPEWVGTRVAFVVTTEDGLRPLQAVSLACP